MKFLLRLLALSSSLLALSSPALRGQVSIAWEEIDKPLSLSLFTGLTPATDRLPYYASGSTAALTPFTGFARTLLDDADATTARATLGLGSISTQAASAVAITGGSIAGITDLAVADGGTGASNAATARTNLGLVIGTHVAGLDIYANPVLGDAEVFAFDNDLATTSSVNNQVAPLIAAESQRIAATFAGTGYGVSDAVTTNRGIIRGPFVAGTRGWIAGVPSLTVWFDFVVPNSNPATEAALFDFSETSNVATTTNALRARFTTTGELLFVAYGASGSDRRNFTYAGFRSAYSGRRVRGRVVFTQGTTNPVVVIDGVDVSASFVASTGGTPPNWLSPSLVATWHVTSFNWPNAEVPYVVPILGTLTTTEAEDSSLRGKWPLWVFQGGHPDSPKTSFVTGFGLVYNTFSGASTTGFSAVKTGGGGGTAVTQFNRRFVGGSVRVRFTATLNSGAVPTIELSDVGVATASSKPAIAAGANDITLTATRPYNGIGFGTNGDADFAISNVVVSFDGALTMPRYQPIPVVEDVTAIGDNYGRLVGIMPLIQEAPDGMTVVVPYNYTGSSIQLMGGAILDGKAYRIDAVTGTSSASVNLSLGTAASGTQIVNAQAVNGNFDISTYASRITTGTSLYLTFSGNTTGTVKIKLSRLN